MTHRTLVIGVLDQVGGELDPELQAALGDSRVLAADVRLTNDDRADFAQLKCADGSHLSGPDAGAGNPN